MPTSSITDNNEVLFRAARRKNHSLTAAVERRILQWLAVHAPQWLTSDQLTLIGFLAQLGAGASYALSRYDRRALLLVIPCLALNWLGDSLDGTLARVRRLERPRYGFYVDHVVDIFGATALICGLLFSNLVHWQVAMAMLVAFLILSSESFLAAYTLSCFELSQSIFGPTEIRILLAAGTVALLRSPYATIFGHKFLLFDLGGTIAAIGMFAVAIFVVLRHTADLYRQEPLP
jgi:archaetidylinositol phosphate synthase